MSEQVQEYTASVLAVLVVAGAIGIAIVEVLRGDGGASIPAWLGGLVGAVAGFFFGRSGVTTGVSKATNGMSQMAAQISQVQQAAEASEQAASQPAKGA